MTQTTLVDLGPSEEERRVSGAVRSVGASASREVLSHSDDDADGEEAQADEETDENAKTTLAERTGMDPSTFHQYGPFRCNSCGKDSADCYRCSECGHDLTGKVTTAGRSNAKQ